MPLVRVEVRNEYALGAPELWRQASKEEDPKEVLEGVAVAGLVGLLRQLGDLAEFAAEVFHGLQEEVSVTSTRSHKLVARVHRIEAALPPLEKAVLAQRSHLHFAYTAGSNWHTRIRCKQNHFVYSDVPQFIMDPYEDSRDPPRLHMLDRFDPGGPGSCLRRYSDPTFFRRASGAFAEVSGKTFKDKKSRKIKKRSSWSRNVDVSRGTSFSYNSGTRNGDVSRGTSFSYSGRMNFNEQNVGKNPSPTQTIVTDDTTLRSDWGEESTLEFRNRSGYIGGDFCPSQSTQPEEQESRVSISSSVKRRDSDFLDFNFLEGKMAHDYGDEQVKKSHKQAGFGSSSVACDEKTETSELGMQDYSPDMGTCDDYHVQAPIPQLFDTRTIGNHAVNSETAHKMDIQSHNQVSSTPGTQGLHPVDVDSELVPGKFGPEAMGDNAAANMGIGDKMDVVRSSNQALPTLESGDVHLEDVESEADDFMDALNIIESESETDTELVKKQAPKPCSKLEDDAVVDGERELIRHHLECQSSNSESNLLANSSQVNDNCDYDHSSVTPLSPSAAYISVGETEAKNETNLVSLVDEAILSAQRARESYNSGSPRTVDSPDNNRTDDGRSVESVSHTGSFNFTDGNSGLSVTDGTRSTPEFRKPGVEIVNVASRAIWTNGGLLGLQPSKPPDLSGSNRDTFPTKGDISGNPYQTEGQNIEGQIMDTPTDEDYQESGTLFRRPTWKLPPSDLDVKLGKLSDLQSLNTASSTGTVPVNSASQAAEKHEENSRSSSRMFELGNRLLTNGSNKKVLPCVDQNSNTSTYTNGNAHGVKNSENAAYQAIFGRSKGSFGVDSLIESPSSSPPLQHMKILLQPIDGFESSQLKMKFADGNTDDESIREIFPSFQLVPEVSITQNNVGSDSDDDTFYRSSPSLSDDCNSRHSQSNSELWESGESPRSKDHDLYDALQRISLTESVSMVPENGSSIHGEIHHTNGLQFPFADNSIQNSQSSRSFDLQSLDVLNQSFREELRNNTMLMNLVEQQLTPSHVPPPLPPVQWRGMKPHMDVIEDKCTAIPEGRNYTLDVKHSESTISQQPKPAPFHHDQNFETINVPKSKIFSSQKSNGGREANPGKNMDEKEDFLQQIRTKSFNLRPIAAAKTTMSSGGAAHVQVTAILEKANAIRQAVGSDDGEDDSNWSDT